MLSDIDVSVVEHTKMMKAVVLTCTRLGLEEDMIEQ